MVGDQRPGADTAVDEAPSDDDNAAVTHSGPAEATAGTGDLAAVSEDNDAACGGLIRRRDLANDTIPRLARQEETERESAILHILENTYESVCCDLDFLIVLFTDDSTGSSVVCGGLRNHSRDDENASSGLLDYGSNESGNGNEYTSDVESILRVGGGRASSYRNDSTGSFLRLGREKIAVEVAVDRTAASATA